MPTSLAPKHDSATMRAFVLNALTILPCVNDRVPLGFICGYPLAGGEQYGGSMFARSAATDTLQGKAITEINTRWGADSLCRAGRETIGIPVCKKKYKPFRFSIVRGEGNVAKVHVERMFGCPCHHPVRKDVIEKHGVRPGWQPFGVWSLRKAQDAARLETMRLNSSPESPILSGNESSDDSDEGDATTKSTGNSATNPVISNICLNGTCTWKVKSAYDDIYKEIHGVSEDEG